MTSGCLLLGWSTFGKKYLRIRDIILRAHMSTSIPTVQATFYTLTQNIKHVVSIPMQHVRIDAETTRLTIPSKTSFGNRFKLLLCPTKIWDIWKRHAWEATQWAGSYNYEIEANIFFIPSRCLRRSRRNGSQKTVWARWCGGKNIWE